MNASFFVAEEAFSHQATNWLAMSPCGRPSTQHRQPTCGAMLPFTDLSVDVALQSDGIVLPRALHGLLL
ncbi:hypothetical protein CO656_21175 [Sinorhizobium sp. FG01]|nr:hypothetical protein CO656_21175 [Sinorhizobium sp. FG01]